MTLEELEFEDYSRLRERRRQYLINPNRLRSWNEMREDGDLDVYLTLNGLF
jgi:hypothetical protein